MIYFIIIIKNVSNARLGESDGYPISTKTPASQNQLTERENSKRQKASEQLSNKTALALLLEAASSTPSKQGQQDHFIEK